MSRDQIEEDSEGEEAEEDQVSLRFSQQSSADCRVDVSSFCRLTTLRLKLAHHHLDLISMGLCYHCRSHHRSRIPHLSLPTVRSRFCWSHRLWISLKIWIKTSLASQAIAAPTTMVSTVPDERGDETDRLGVSASVGRRDEGGR